MSSEKIMVKSEEWEKVKFTDVFLDMTSKAKKIPKENYLKEGKYPIIDQGKNKVAGYSNENTALFEEFPVIVFGDHTRIIKYVDFPIFIGADGVKILKPKVENTYCKYLFYVLKSVPIIDTGYNRHFKWLKESEILLPPLEIQKQTADELDKITELIEKKKQQIEKLDLLVKAKFIEVFGDPELNPMGWERGTIRDVVNDVKYGTSKPAVENGRYPYLRMNNITYSGELDITNLKYIDVNESEYKKYVVKSGDILFNRTNSKELVGKTCVFDLNSEMIIAGYIIRIRVNEKAIPSYISSYLNSRYGKAVLFDMCKSIVGQANINAQELQDIKISIPSIELQKQFDEYEKRVKRQKEKLQDSLEQLEILYKQRMQEYFE